LWLTSVTMPLPSSTVRRALVADKQQSHQVQVQYSHCALPCCAVLSAAEC
jgi:hypothetical protein